MIKQIKIYRWYRWYKDNFNRQTW